MFNVNVQYVYSRLSHLFASLSLSLDLNGKKTTLLESESDTNQDSTPNGPPTAEQSTSGLCSQNNHSVSQRTDGSTATTGVENQQEQDGGAVSDDFLQGQGEPATTPQIPGPSSDATQNIDVVPQSSNCAIGREPTTVTNNNVDDKHWIKDILLHLIVPCIEVIVFGIFSIALFLTQAITHSTCKFALDNALNNSTVIERYNESIIQKLTTARDQYSVLLPYNVFTIIFIILQVSFFRVVLQVHLYIDLCDYVSGIVSAYLHVGYITSKPPPIWVIEVV